MLKASLFLNTKIFLIKIYRIKNIKAFSLNLFYLPPAASYAVCTIIESFCMCLI